MKVIPLSKAKAKLNYYSKVCRREPFIVTVKGVPAFQMLPLDEDEDLIDRLQKHNPAFRQLLKNSWESKDLTAEEALSRLK